MKTDLIRTNTDSDISDNHICVSFQFLFFGMEMDRIRRNTNSDISNILEYPFSYFLNVYLIAGSLGWFGSNPDFGDGANPSIVWLHF